MNNEYLAGMECRDNERIAKRKEKKNGKSIV